MKKIIFTGGSGRFGEIFKKKTNIKNIYYPSKSELNILNKISINKYFSKNKPKIVIHAAGLSRPMNLHDTKIPTSIEKNIVGTCNLVIACSKLKIKLIYLSTNYVYPGIRGNYKETDALLPYNNYALSKLGGECAVQMYNNSLVIRLSMTEKPFVHKHAFKDQITNFMFHEEVVKIFPKLLNIKGVINLGGKSNSVFNFAKKYNKNIKPISSSKLLRKKIPLNHSMNLKKIKKILK